MDGIAAAIIHKNRILLIKRRFVPFIIVNPGAWSLLFGTRKEDEPYLETAYREIEEETSIERSDLQLVGKPFQVEAFDISGSKRWKNMMFIFKSGTEKVKLDIENSRYRWASYKEIKGRVGYTNIFSNPEAIEKRIKRALDGR